MSSMHADIELSFFPLHGGGAQQFKECCCYVLGSYRKL